MTKPSKAAIARAARLITENYRSEGFVNFTYSVRDVDSPLDRAFAHFIQEVSDVAKGITQRQEKLQGLLQFILPDPEPDVWAELREILPPLAFYDMSQHLMATGYAITKVQP